MSDRNATMSPPRPAGRLRNWLPLAAIVILAGIAYAMGWHRHLTFRMIALNFETLREYIDQNVVVALALFVLAYATVVAISLPGASLMTLTGGLLFGWKLAIPAAVVAATTGATIFFLVARTSLGEALAKRAGPAIAGLRKGFSEDALSYMLFLRLVPVFPFVVVNLAAALLGVPLGAFVLSTFVGIIPGTAAYSVAGSGLGSVVRAQNAVYQACVAGADTAAAADACPYRIDTSALVTKELAVAFALLGVVALIPVVLKKWKARNAAV